MRPGSVPPRLCLLALHRRCNRPHRTSGLRAHLRIGGHSRSLRCRVSSALPGTRSTRPSTAPPHPRITSSLTWTRSGCALSLTRGGLLPSSSSARRRLRSLPRRLMSQQRFMQTVEQETRSRRCVFPGLAMSVTLTLFVKAGEDEVLQAARQRRSAHDADRAHAAIRVLDAEKVCYPRWLSRLRISDS